MKIFRTLVQRADDGALFAADTIEFEGRLWLVPEWLAGPTEGTERPARLIGLHGLVLEKAHPPYDKEADQILLVPLSKATLAGGTAQGLDVIEAPDVVRSVDQEDLLH